LTHFLNNKVILEMQTWLQWST